MRGPLILKLKLQPAHPLPELFEHTLLIRHAFGFERG
jgi:hypothetical protein